MFTKFKSRYYEVNDIKIHCRIGGSGPALVLLHGHPQTHFIWHKIADTLALDYTVVAPDLRGYGDSDKPDASGDAHTYSKRTMALDVVSLMQTIGFEQFCVLAHDRGARVAHRLAVDHPTAVQKMILLDIAPTLAMYEQTNEDFARAYWHWFFLIRPAPLPETLIEADPEGYLRSVMGTRSAGMSPFTDSAFAEYLRCLAQPGAARGICEDYRASASIDLDHERADIAASRRLTCPLLVLWGRDGAVGRYFKPLKEWKKIATDVEGEALPSGHYIPEEVPDLLLEKMRHFMARE
ncbi:alpha/beta fold hydrolase [Kordiimonas sp.]|uniref:alpha/beta fold hydrolase n=1 Tax=Kordiimonas sp. TaxID=1970157 RepID=UPI003A8D79E4